MNSIALAGMAAKRKDAPLTPRLISLLGSFMSLAMLLTVIGGFVAVVLTIVKLATVTSVSWLFIAGLVLCPIGIIILCLIGIGLLMRFGSQVWY